MDIIRRGYGRHLGLTVALVAVLLVAAACGTPDAGTGDAAAGSTPSASCAAAASHDGATPAATSSCSVDGPDSTDATKVTIIVTGGMAFDHDRHQMTAGMPVVLELVNEDAVLHDLTIEGINATDEVVEPHAGEHQQGHEMSDLKPGTVHLVAEIGERISVTFTPRAGTFEFYCSVPGHREAGMTGTITVD